MGSIMDSLALTSVGGASIIGGLIVGASGLAARREPTDFAALIVDRNRARQPITAAHLDIGRGDFRRLGSIADDIVGHNFAVMAAHNTDLATPSARRGGTRMLAGIAAIGLGIGAIVAASRVSDDRSRGEEIAPGPYEAPTIDTYPNGVDTGGVETGGTI